MVSTKTPQWLCNQWQCIKKQAIKILTRLSLDYSFKVSEDWLQEWKKRHKVSFKAVKEEGTTVDKQATTDWIDGF